MPPARGFEGTSGMGEYYSLTRFGGRRRVTGQYYNAANGNELTKEASVCSQSTASL